MKITLLHNHCTGLKIAYCSSVKLMAYLNCRTESVCSPINSMEWSPPAQLVKPLKDSSYKCKGCSATAVQNPRERRYSSYSFLS
jgi:hypothetical protein